MAHLDFKAEYEDTIAGSSGTHFDIDDVVAATGDLLIVYAHTQSSGDQPGANDCSDTQSSTYSAVVNIDSADNMGVRLWAAEAAGANPDIDIDCGAIDFYTAVAKCLVVDGAGGDLAAVAGDATDSAESTNGTVSTASITADNSPAFVVCAGTCDDVTNDETTGGFTELSQASNAQFESGYVRQATASSINASFSRGGSPFQDHGAVIAAWSESAGATANPKGVLGGLVFGGPFGGPVG